MPSPLLAVAGTDVRSYASVDSVHGLLWSRVGTQLPLELEQILATLNREFSTFEQSFIGKWVEILKELAPGIELVAMIFNPKTAPGGGSVRSIRLRAHSA
jgi:hypothetical protein